MTTTDAAYVEIYAANDAGEYAPTVWQKVSDGEIVSRDEVPTAREAAADMEPAPGSWVRVARWEINDSSDYPMQTAASVDDWQVRATTITARDLADEMADRYDITVQAAREAIDTYLGQVWAIDGTEGDTDAISAEDAETVRDQMAADYR